MLLRGITHKAPADRGPVPCLSQVTLNSARRRPLRQTGFFVRRSLSPRQEPALNPTSSATYVELFLRRTT